MDRRRLGKTSVELSPLGFGASPLGGVFGDVSQAQADEAVRTAIDVRFTPSMTRFLSPTNQM